MNVSERQLRNLIQEGEGLTTEFKACRDQLVEDDVFRMVISVPEFGERSVADGGVEKGAPEVTPEVARMIRVLEGDMARTDIMTVLGLKDEKHFREKYRQPGVAAGVIEMTIPDRPRSSKQKYRLTDKGRHVLKDLQS